MTSRQRILAAMRMGTPDRVPVTPFGLGHLDRTGEAARDLIRKTDPILTTGWGGDAFLGRAADVRVDTEGDTRRTTLRTP